MGEEEVKSVLTRLRVNVSVRGRTHMRPRLRLGMCMRVFALGPNTDYDFPLKILLCMMLHAPVVQSRVVLLGDMVVSSRSCLVGPTPLALSFDHGTQELQGVCR